MIKRILFVVACLSMFGCEGIPASSVVPAPPPPPAPAPPLPQLHCDGTGACIVNIINPTCTGSVCTAEVDADPVKFKRGKPDINIHWKLPNGYGFCEGGTGDGVYLKGPDTLNQFKDPGIDAAAGTDACKHKQFKWTAKNTDTDKSFPYLIRFHDATGTRSYLVDPVMINE